MQCGAKQVNDRCFLLSVLVRRGLLGAANGFVAAAAEEEELGFSGGEEEEEDSGEWTEESDDEEQADHRVMLKPVFVPKNKRATIAQKEELELEEERVAEQEALRLLERKEESKVPALDLLRLKDICIASVHTYGSCYSQRSLLRAQPPRRASPPSPSPPCSAALTLSDSYNGAFAGAIITDDEVRPTITQPPPASASPLCSWMATRRSSCGRSAS
jgi:hypothetical protein